MRIPNLPGRRDAWILLAMLTAVAAWLWPLGVGGRMPVGGDVTSFQIGLMAEYQRAIRAFRLPLWNANWGFGFPGLAESQMGVYYPPHVVLYGLLPLELAYTVSLVLHTFWAALGTYLCARRMGTSGTAAALAGFVWATCGFFVIHITHQWAYTCASWMPWAWVLTWTLVRGPRTRRTWLGLAAVLCVQMLPGHFQLAFITQVTVLGMGLWSVVDDGWSRLVRNTAGVWRRWSLLLILFSLLFAGFLAACQLRPTWDLARRAESNRTYEYLSGFAQSPAHLVSYYVPGLFHVSPLWRPVAWDPFHTSPEECLAYVGLVPLWLALATVWRRWRIDPAVRMLSMLALLTLLLSMGPYVPGFSWLIRLPGFSFFRAPARWGAATMLAIALLAAIGFDHVTTWRHTRGSVLRFCALAILLPALCVGAFELALASTERNGSREVADTIERARQMLPWDGDPTLREVMDAARRPGWNPITLTGLARRGIDEKSRLDQTRASIYWQELLPSGVLLIALVAAVVWRSATPQSSPRLPTGDTVGSAAQMRNESDSPSQLNPLVFLPDKRGREEVSPPGKMGEEMPSRLQIVLVVLTVADLLLNVRLRDVDSGPIRSLVEQSPVLRRLAHEAMTSRGRIVSPLGNLPMVGGAASVPAYRTLDLPVGKLLLQRAMQVPVGFSMFMDMAIAMNRMGATLRVAQPGEYFEVDPRLRVESIDDPTLARWLAGRPNPTGEEATFTVLPFRQPSRFDLLQLSPNFFEITIVSKLQWHEQSPEKIEVAAIVRPPRDDGLRYAVVMKQTPDPEWTGVWKSAERREPAVFRRAAENPDDSFLLAPVPGPGEWTLELRYEGRAARAGLIASAVAWAVWLALWFAPWRSWRQRTAVA